MRSVMNAGRLLWRVHDDEEGGVSLETLLVVGAIALPILAFTLRVGWPRVREYFNQGLRDLDVGRRGAVR